VNFSGKVFLLANSGEQNKKAPQRGAGKQKKPLRRGGGGGIAMRPENPFQDRETLLAWFKEQNFRDSIGHPLTGNMDFLYLVDMALAYAGQISRGEENPAGAGPAQGSSGRKYLGE
jgi:hypothetical protein